VSQRRICQRKGDSYTRQRGCWDSLDILADMMLLIDVAEQIAKRRKANGLTQAELAKMARVSRSTLDALENGRMGELGYAKVNNLLTALGLEFKLQTAVSIRPTLDELMLENERDDAELRRSSRF
jgi:transcriptional regulator with XRE-family HTH domain